MSDMKWADILPTRVPGYFHNTNLTDGYIKSVGEFYDEMVEFIKSFDDIQDYQESPRRYLPELQKKFGIEPECQLPTDKWRQMIRDVDQILRTKGTQAAFEWALKVAGWDSVAEYAWLPHPELYDSRLQIYFPEIYANFDANLGADALYDRTRYGERYEFGIPRQIFAYHAQYVCRDELRYGGTTFVRIGASENDLLINRITPGDIEIDHRDGISPAHFVYGEQYDQVDGTWFRGHTFFDPHRIYERMPILGNHYGLGMITEDDIPVMATPYVLIRVFNDGSDRDVEYTKHDGTVAIFDKTEYVKVQADIVSYFLENFVRPVNVRVLGIYCEAGDHDIVGINESFKLELIGDAIVDLGANDETIGVSGINTIAYDGAETQLKVGGGAVVGQPTYQSPNAYNAQTVTVGTTLSPQVGRYSTTTFTYSDVVKFSNTKQDMIDLDSSSGQYSNVSNSVLCSRIFALRTPSLVRLTTSSGDEPLIIKVMGRSFRGAKFEEIGEFVLSPNGDIHHLGFNIKTQGRSIFNYTDIFFMINNSDNAKAQTFNTTATITWRTQNNLDFSKRGIQAQ